MLQCCPYLSERAGQNKERYPINFSATLYPWSRVLIGGSESVRNEASTALRVRCLLNREEEAMAAVGEGSFKVVGS